MPRLKEVTAGEMTAEQTAACERVSAALGALHGPYAAWIRRPKLADTIFSVLQCLREDGIVPRRMRMVATLVAVKVWGADYAWGVNAPLALDAGVPQTIVDAINQHHTPQFSDAGDEIAYNLAHEILTGHDLSDATFARGLALLGDDAMVELVTIVGYFAMVAITVRSYDLQARQRT